MSHGVRDPPSMRGTEPYIAGGDDMENMKSSAGPI